MIILHAEGQTGNKFFIYRNYIADCIENKEKILILVPDIAMVSFPNLWKSREISFPLFFNAIASLIGFEKYIRTLDFWFGNKYSLKLFSIFFKIIPRVQFVRASIGAYKSPNRGKYNEEVKKLFTPDPLIEQEVVPVFDKIRTDFDIVCGIHIRYGDYKEFMGGKYFYTKEQYLNKIEGFARLFPEKKIAFFVASNENIDLSFFQPNACFVLQNSSAVKDLCGLSVCDYIIGPPSSFSGWASYYGDNSIYFIEDPDEKVTSASFRSIIDIWNLNN